jgi:hypothetical protein
LLIGEDDSNMVVPKPRYVKLYEEAAEKSVKLQELRKKVEEKN